MVLMDLYELRERERERERERAEESLRFLYIGMGNTSQYIVFWRGVLNYSENFDKNSD